MPSFPSLSATFYLAVNVYWGLATLVAWSAFCGLSGYLCGYLGRRKYIILRESDIANCPPPFADVRTRDARVEPENQ